MNITVLRGTHQIGGCVTEIRTDKTRILIDTGAELPDEDGNTTEETLSIEGVTEGPPNCDGVLFTHYHGDHIGMLDRILPGIPLFMGQASKEIFLTLQERVNPKLVPAILAIKTFEAPKKFQIGDITITPLMVDHSAFDAHMFLIEADGKKILHTGDFRTHGFRGKGVIPTLKEYAGKVDVLITEGTTLSRDESCTITEHDLQNEAKKLLSDYKYVFVICSSTNIDRLASFSKATPRDKYYLCDAFQEEIIEIAKKYGAKHTSLYSFENAQEYNKALAEKAEKKGFCMMVRGNDYFLKIMREYRDRHNSECLVIYSLWDGYLTQPNSRLKLLIDGFQNVTHKHTSGHATPKAIADVCNTVSPSQAIIPIHSTNSKKLGSLNLPYHIEYLQDLQVYEV